MFTVTKNALLFCNSDNCHGDNFYNPTVDGMAKAVKSCKVLYDVNNLGKSKAK